MPTTTDIREGDPCWLRGAKHCASSVPLTEDAACEVAVVGAGVSGALVAHRLARAGVDVAVLDRAQPASGSSAACTALVQYDLDSPLVELAKVRGEDVAQHVYHVCYSALDRVEAIASMLPESVQLKPRPSLLVARKARDVKSMRTELEARQAIGLDVRWADEAELRDAWNVDRPGAIVSSRSLELDPYAFTSELLADAVNRGARLFAPAEVMWDDELVQGDIVPLRTAHGPVVRAKHVVVATGYKTPACVAEYYGKLHSTWAACTEPIANLDQLWPKRQLIWEWGDAYFYARTRPDNSVVFGGADRPFKSGTLRELLIEPTTKSLVETLRALVPGIEPKVRNAWCGTFGVTKDTMPYIGSLPDADPRVMYVLGFGGNGVTFSTIAAEVACERITGASDLPGAGELFGFDR